MQYEKYARLRVEDYLLFAKRNLSRNIIMLHRHHTWKPDYKTWYNRTDKKSIMLGMENYHKSLGWDDIGQHATLDPDGYVWICRDLNKIPCSIKGYNTGAWALEMIGDFDIGKDQMTEEQKVAMVLLFAGMQDITGARIVDHNEYSAKTCPGTSLKKINLLKAIESFRKEAEPMEKWKEEGIDYLSIIGAMNDPEKWRNQLEEPMPTWAVTLLLKRIHEIR